MREGVCFLDCLFPDPIAGMLDLVLCGEARNLREYLWVILLPPVVWELLLFFIFPDCSPSPLPPSISFFPYSTVPRSSDLGLFSFYCAFPRQMHLFCGFNRQPCGNSWAHLARSDPSAKPLSPNFQLPAGYLQMDFPQAQHQIHNILINSPFHLCSLFLLAVYSLVS